MPHIEISMRHRPCGLAAPLFCEPEEGRVVLLVAQQPQRQPSGLASETSRAFTRKQAPHAFLAASVVIICTGETNLQEQRKYFVSGYEIFLWDRLTTHNKESKPSSGTTSRQCSLLRQRTATLNTPETRSSCEERNSLLLNVTVIS